MKGYWHFPAIGVLFGFLIVLLDNQWLFFIFLLWLLYLFYLRRLGAIVFILSLIFAITASIYIPQLDPAETKDFSSIHEMVFSGEITSPLNESDNRLSFKFTDKHSEETFQVVYFKENKKMDHELKYGAECTIQGTPELADTKHNPGQFDYQRYLLTQDIRYQMILNSLEKIECSGSSMMHTIYELRSDMIGFVKENLSADTASWLNALVFGEDSALDDHIIDQFQRWSLSHLLAISGLHVGIVVAMIYFLLIRLNWLTKEKAQWVILFLLPIYALLAGGEPSVLRAALMVILLLVAKKRNWKLSVTDVLSIVLLGLVFFNPLIFYHIGFQFSFCVTFGLLLSKKWLSQSTNYLFSMLNISFVSQMIILPLQIIYFHTFQPLSILLNLIVVPYFTLFVIPYMFGLLLFMPVGGLLVTYFDQIFIFIHNLFLKGMNWIDELLYVPWIIGSFPAAAVIIYYILFITFMTKLELTHLKQAFKFGAFITIFIIIIVIKPYFSPIGRLTMLDIGQGDSMVLELPYRQGVIFIDAGAHLTFGDNNSWSDTEFKQVIQPYLYSRGIDHIDAVFISHADIDHMGSVKFMSEDMTVENVIVSGYFEFPDELMDALKQNDTNIIRASLEDTVTVGDNDFRVIAPVSDKNDPNENSLVLQTDIGGKTWLFTGDIGKKTEKRILNRYPGLKADVLKVGHHGSNTSTDPEFIQKLQPEYALISAGRNSQYGHPHQEVLETLKDADIKLYRTDEDGAIEYYFESKNGIFSTFLP